jgi:NADH dehydrogenase FAD-containing subunit
VIGYALSALLSVVIVVAGFFGVAFAGILLDRLAGAHHRGVERVRRASVSPAETRR